MHPFEDTSWPGFLVKARNDVAAGLSVIPGLGHFYKGYALMGISLMLLTPVMVFAGLICGALTLGVGLVIPLGYWVAVGWAAYELPDHRKHHLIH